MTGCPVEEVFPGVFHIRTPGNVFCTLIVGGRSALLVDSGFGIVDLAGMVQDLSGGKKTTLVNTHGHFDHVLGDYQFAEAYLDPRDFQLLDFISEESKRRVLDATGFPDMEADDKFWKYSGENIFPLQCRSFDLGDLSVECLEIPNHTKGSTGFLIHEYRLLVSGDAVAPCVSLIQPGASSIEESIAVLKKVKEYGFDHILSSHSGSLHEKSMIDRLITCSMRLERKTSVPYEDPFYPQYKGRLFAFIESGNLDEAVYVCC